MSEKKEDFLGITMQGWVQIAVMLAAVVFAFFLITWSEGNISYSGGSTAATAEFAECLTDHGAVFYGTSWCPHCNDQKELFGEYFGKVNFVDCEESRAACSTAGITAYPTWIINKQKYLGTKSLETLGELAGCKLA